MGWETDRGAEIYNDCSSAAREIAPGGGKRQGHIQHSIESGRILFQFRVSEAENEDPFSYPRDSVFSPLLSLFDILLRVIIPPISVVEWPLCSHVSSHLRLPISIPTHPDRQPQSVINRRADIGFPLSLSFSHARISISVIPFLQRVICRLFPHFPSDMVHT